MYSLSARASAFCGEMCAAEGTLIKSPSHACARSLHTDTLKHLMLKIYIYVYMAYPSESGTDKFTQSFI